MKLKAEGILRKMRSRLDPIVGYEMSLSREYVQINEMIGKGLKLEFQIFRPQLSAPSTIEKVPIQILSFSKRFLESS